MLHQRWAGYRGGLLIMVAGPVSSHMGLAAQTARILGLEEGIAVQPTLAYFEPGLPVGSCQEKWGFA